MGLPQPSPADSLALPAVFACIRVLSETVASLPLITYRVRRDGEGLLHFVGRRDAMIKSAGNRISPQEIEEAVLVSGLVVEAVALVLYLRRARSAEAE